MLHEARCADIAERSARAADCCENVGAVGNAGRHHYIAQTLAGQRQALGVGVAHDSVVIDIRHKGHAHAAVNELAVRLVGDEVNAPALLLLRSIEYLRHHPERLLAQNSARGVVGRIYDHRRYVSLTDGILKRGHERLHIVARGRYYYDLRSGIFGKHLVFREERCEQHDLLALADERRHAYRQRRGRAGCQIYALCRYLVSGSSALLPGCGLSRRHRAGSGRVAVQTQAVPALQELDEGVLHLLRCGNIGVSYAEVENVFAAYLAAALVGVGRDNAYLVFAFAEGEHFFFYHGLFLLFWFLLIIFNSRYFT